MTTKVIVNTNYWT